MIRFSPRRPQSIWSTVNLRRIAELERLGRMAEAGRKVHAARNPARQQRYSFEQRPEKMSPAYEKRLRANRAAWVFLESQPPWYRRVARWYVISAKREETRERRLEILIAACASGKRIGLVTGSPSKRTK